MDFDGIRQQFSLHAQLLRYGAKIGRDGRFRCVIPGHRDKNPSASYTKRNGVEHWRCHACDRGGDVIDLVAEVEGVPLGEAARRLTGDAPPRPQEARTDRSPDREDVGLVFDLAPVPDDAAALKAGAETPPILSKRGKVSTVTPADTYAYHLPDGTKVGYVLRILTPEGGKKHLPVRWDVSRGWVWAGWSGEDRAPLYNAPAIVRREDAPILLVEGEKCCKLARALMPDYVVTCWLGGTAGVKRADFNLLRGREVTFWPDADDIGRAAMKTAIAKAGAARSWWVEPSADWAAGYDIADLIADEGIEGARSFMSGREEVRPKKEPGELPPPGSWQQRSQGGWLPDGTYIDLTKDNTLTLKSEINATLAVRHHPIFETLCFDIIRRQLVFRGEPVTTDTLRTLQYELMRNTQLKLAVSTFAQVVEDIATARHINPVADRLRSLQWDGLHRPLADYAGVLRTPWSEAAFKRWFLGLIRRILEPGCQHDLMLVIEGAQGLGKTSFLRTLGQGVGYDSYLALFKFNTEGDHSMMQFNGKIVVEVAEMVAYRKGDREAFKALLSGKVDHYRRPYSRDFVDLPRCCVFAGSTNQLSGYLTDATGNRRIVPVRCLAQARIPDLERDLDQIFAEGVATFDSLRAQGEALNWFTPAELAMQEAETSRRELPSILADMLDFHLETAPPSFDMGTVWGWLAIGQPRDRKTFLPELIEEMRRRGWDYRKGSTRDDRTWRWRPLESPV